MHALRHELRVILHYVRVQRLRHQADLRRAFRPRDHHQRLPAVGGTLDIHFGREQAFRHSATPDGGHPRRFHRHPHPLRCLQVHGQDADTPAVQRQQEVRHFAIHHLRADSHRHPVEFFRVILPALLQHLHAHLRKRDMLNQPPVEVVPESRFRFQRLPAQFRCLHLFGHVLQLPAVLFNGGTAHLRRAVVPAYHLQRYLIHSFFLFHVSVFLDRLSHIFIPLRLLGASFRSGSCCSCCLCSCRWLRGAMRNVSFCRSKVPHGLSGNHRAPRCT